MPHVFLSYAPEDADTAREIANGLESSDFSVRWDRTVPPGSTFEEFVQEAMDNCFALLALWSEHGSKSSLVKSEAEEAARRGVLVPIQLDQTKLPGSLDLHRSVDLASWLSSGQRPEWSSLVDRLSMLQRRGPKVVPLPPEPPSGPSQTQPVPPQDPLETTLPVSADAWKRAEAGQQSRLWLVFAAGLALLVTVILLLG